MSTFASEKKIAWKFILSINTMGLAGFNPNPAKLIYLKFQPLEVVSRYRDPQPQVAEKYSYLFNLTKNICKS